ncbi:MAG: DUF1232 domain-containing protein [Desulfuromonas sp.]|nr:MAG: DUF1232 domain-containing protein [Desulfuromonas sp.]
MKNRFKDFLVAVAGVIALIYLLNPGAGLFELIPDNLPFIGNLDEAAAAALLLTVLRHFGFDLVAFLGRLTSRQKKT